MGIKVDLLLVNPGNRLEQFATLSDLATVAPPLGIGLIAAFVRRYGFSAAIIDAEAEFWTPEQTITEIEKYDPILVGLSAFTTKMTAAGKILELIKSKMPHVKTMAGGHHPSAVPEQTLIEEKVDFVIKGEGYIPTLDLLRRLKEKKDTSTINGVWCIGNKGEVINNGLAKWTSNLDNLPFVAWDLLPMDKYRAHHWQTWDYNLDQSRFAVLHTSLGCPFSCDYCSVNVVYQKNLVRYRGVKKVVDEMELLVKNYNVQHLEIVDDTFTVNAKRVELLCDEIIKRGLGEKLNMWCFSRTNTVQPKFMNKMKKAGINWVFMGFESGNDMVLRGVNKKQNVDKIRRAVDIVSDAGIYVGGNYVFGLPEDTKLSMEQTIDLAKNLNTEYANFFVMMAYPGTEFNRKAKANNKPLPNEWRQYGFFAPDSLPLENAQLTAEEILKFRDNSFVEYFQGKSYQAMIEKKFGSKILNFINNKILSKKIIRTKPRFKQKRQISV